MMTTMEGRPKRLMVCTSSYLWNQWRVDAQQASKNITLTAPVS